MASAVDDSVQSTVLTGMSAEVSGASARRSGRFDQLAADSGALWTVAMTSPTIYGAQSIRMLNGTPGNFGNAIPGTAPAA